MTRKHLAPCLLAALLLATVAAARGAEAQAALGRWRVHAGLGVGLYSGGSNEGGSGATLQLDAEHPVRIGLLRFEATAATYAAMFQRCLTSVPGSCDPERPPATVVSLSAIASAPASGTFYLLAGLAAYSRAATDRHGALGNLGAELGAGLRMAPRAALELRGAIIGRGDAAGQAIGFRVRYAF